MYSSIYAKMDGSDAEVGFIIEFQVGSRGLTYFERLGFFPLILSVQLARNKVKINRK